MRLRGAQNYRFSLCPLPHTLATHYFLRLTRARGESSQREGNALFDDFWYFSSQKSTIKEKFLYVSIRRQQATALRTKPKYSQQPKQKIYAYPLFLLHIQAQKKKLSKRKRRKKISHSAERDKGDLPLTQPPFEKGGRKL